MVKKMAAQVEKKRAQINIKSANPNCGLEANIRTESLSLLIDGERQNVNVSDRKYYLSNGEYCILFKNALLQIAKLKLNRVELTTLLYLISTADKEGTININSSIISRTVSIDGGNIRKAIKKLKALNIIIEVDEKMKLNIESYAMHAWTGFMLNYNLTYSGKVAAFGGLLQLHPPLLGNNGEKIYESPRLGIERIKKIRQKIKKTN